MKAVMAGNISLHPRVRPYIYNQARLFDITKSDNKDDGLDVMSYVEEVFQEYSEHAFVELEAVKVPGVQNTWEVTEVRGGFHDFSDIGIDFNG